MFIRLLGNSGEYTHVADTCFECCASRWLVNRHSPLEGMIHKDETNLVEQQRATTALRYHELW